MQGDLGHEFLWTNDRDTSEGVQDQQISVTSDKVICATTDGE